MKILCIEASSQVKRLFDLVIGSMFLLMCLPFFTIIFIILKIDSQGPAFFGHTRIGRHGKPFTCWKFRTMYSNAEEVLGRILAEDSSLRMEWEKDFKLKNDPRITNTGKFLRKTSLDELPQIWNVLKGEMSLVGPRPIVERELERYGSCVEDYLHAKPGITGLWQVSGRNDLDYAERVRLDSWYVRNWSVWLDITILFRTVSTILNRRGAY